MYINKIVKNTKKSLATLTVIGLAGLGLTNANRDQVRNVPYSAIIGGSYNIEVNLENTACSTTKTLRGDVYDILNFEGYKTDGVVVSGDYKSQGATGAGVGEEYTDCSKTKNGLYCTTTVLVYKNGTQDGSFHAMAENKTILEYLGAPEAAIDKVYGDYYQLITASMNAMISTGGGETRYAIEDGEAVHSFYDLGSPALFGGDNTIRYFDISECSIENEDPVVKTSTGIIDVTLNASPNLGTGSLTSNITSSFSGASDIINYEWKINGLKIENNTGSLNQEFINAGGIPTKVFNIELKVTDDFGDTGIGYTTVSVNEDVTTPTATGSTATGTTSLGVSITADPTTFGTGSLLVNMISLVEGSSNDLSYKWTIDGIELTNNNKDLLFNYVNNGPENTLNYLVRLDVVDNEYYPSGEKTGYASEIITINKAPVVTPTPGPGPGPGPSPASIDIDIEASVYGGMSPLDVSFSGAVSGGSGTLTYRWEVDKLSGVLGPVIVGTNSGNLDHTFYNSGSLAIEEYEVILYVEDGDGNTASGSKIINVLQADDPIVVPPSLPVEEAIFSYINIAGCSAETGPVPSGFDSEYSCYATGSIDLDMQLSRKGDYGINYLDIGLNNETNTSSIGFINLSKSGATNVNNNLLTEFNNLDSLAPQTITIGLENFNNLNGTLNLDGTNYSGLNNPFTKSETYTLEIEGKGILSKPNSFANVHRIKLNIIPTNNIEVGPLTVSDKSVYADGTSIINFKQIIQDEYSNPITHAFGDYTSKGYNSSSYVDVSNSIVDLNGVDQLKVENIKFEGGHFSFDLRSLAPSLNEIIDVRYRVPQHTEEKVMKHLSDGSGGYFFSNFFNINTATVCNDSSTGCNVVNFEYPFDMEFYASNDRGSNWSNRNELGQPYMYELRLTNSGAISYSSGAMTMNSTSLKANVDGHFWQNYETTDDTFDTSSEVVSFSGVLNCTSNCLIAPEIATNDLEIEYTLNLASGNVAVKYHTQPIKEFLSELAGLKVVGNIQGQGNTTITGQEENFSDISTNTQRDSIRKNAYKIISGMTSGQVVNGVRYVEGDVTISGDPANYETLVVKDGNVIIDGNLNISESKLGIIVLKDGYDVNSDYTNSGNVYIDKDVTRINAVIYADGAILSSNGSSVYTDRTRTTVEDLSKQLILKGTVFTRNTIGGAILNGTYKLPGGKSTSDYELAALYDLNHTRKGVRSCQDDDLDYICDYRDYFIIIYDNKVQLDPPRGFDL